MNQINQINQNSKQGGWEMDEATAAEAASREAFEEGGIRGITGASLSPTRAMSKGDTVPVRCEWFVTYVDELLNEWPEAFERSRIVVSLDEAIKMVHREEHRMALEEV
jgi:8-oxo-dGTP pyrophosphatase MutT (NUDIX family)